MIAKTDEMLSTALASANDPDVVERRAAVRVIRNIALRTRTSLEKRGTLALAAESPLVDQDSVLALNQILNDDDLEVRLTAAKCIRDVGDASSVSDLANRISDPSAEVRLEAINALGEIGGAGAVRLLASQAASPQADTDARLAALAALEELVTKDMTDGPDLRVETDVLARAATPPEGSRVVAALRQAATDETLSPFGRLKATEVLSYLG